MVTVLQVYCTDLLPEKVAAIYGPVLLCYILNREQAISILLALVLLGQDGKPRQYCPQAVLFSHMVTASSK